MKINISQEDYEFLKNLQHELNIQENDGKLRKSTGYGNYQYGNDVRLATEEEIKAFIIEVFNYQDPIREYGRP